MKTLLPARPRVFAVLLLLASSASAQVNEKVVIERDVEYGRVGDRVLKLDVVRPREKPERPMPVVCFVHGGGWAGGNKRVGVPLLVPMAEKGYFGVSVGYRLTGEATWPAQIHDCKAAIRWIRASAKKYHLDPDRIGVWGMSAGGHLVALLGTSGGVKALEGQCGSPDQSSRVTCVLNWFGPADLVAASKDPEVLPRVKRLLDGLVGGPAADHQDALKAASPVTYVSRDDAPTLTMHGSNDRIVPLSQAKMLDAALDEAGVPSALVIVHGAGHGFGGDDVFSRCRAFFDEHLRGGDGELKDETIRGE